MRVTLLIAGILLVSICRAQNPLIVKYSNTITAQELEKHLKIIASDQYEGRGTGEPGLDLASKYITAGFIADKLTGLVKDSKNPYYQEFKLEKKIWTKLSLSTAKEYFANYKDIAFLSTDEGTKEFDVIFAGYGIYSDSYSDYNLIDVKDKIVAFMIGEPKSKSGVYLTTGKSEPSFKMDTTINSKFESVQSKAMASIMRGAKGFILIEENDIEAAKSMKLLEQYLGGSQVTFPGQKDINESFPVMYMSPSEAARLFGTTKKKFEKVLNDSIAKGSSPAGKYIQKVKIEAERITTPIKSGNVLGYIEGTDKKDETLIICGHYDHEGIKKGEIYNGADDNGSGTVGLLEIAQAFSLAKGDGNGPRRSILFIALTGEEKGLLGSKYYAQNPVLPLSSTVSALNIDMLGRIDNEHKQDSSYVYIIGSDYMSSQLHKINDESDKTYTPEIKLDYKYNDKNDPEKLYYRSDQISFAEKGVPVIFYTSGLHADYHTPKDDADKIAYKVLANRLKLIFATAWELANRNERVKVDKK